jgi:hypothetical protein
MFRALLAHPQEDWSGTPVALQSWRSQQTQHARNTPSAACAGPSEDEKVMLETCKVSKFRPITGLEGE